MMRDVRLKSGQGFTLVELVMTIVIIGIMGAVAAPRFFSSSVFQSRGFADQLKSTLRYAQKAAAAQNRYICATVNSNSVTLSLDATVPSAAHAVASCTVSMTSPSGQSPYTLTAPNGVTLSGGAAFYFNVSGKPSAAQSITVSGNATPVTVEAETGYVH